MQDHRQTVIVKGQQRVVQDKRTGLGRGEDQVRHRQTEGQVELVGGALAQERQGAVGQGAGLPDGDVETAVQGHLREPSLGQLLEVSGGCLAQLGGEPGVELIVGLL